MLRDLLSMMVPPVAPKRVLVARVSDEASLVQVAKRLHSLGLKKFDVHSPYPIHGMESAMGLPSSPLPIFTLLATIGGSLGFIAFVLFAAHDYPMVHSGKGPMAFWAYIPAWAEVTWIIAGTLILAFGLLLMGLPMFSHPLFQSKTYLDNHADGFTVSVDLSDPRCAEISLSQELEKLGATSIETVEEAKS